MASEKLRVLFLCTGNSARSQMAEALVNARLGEHWQAVSAGVKPSGQVNPHAIRALAEMSIQHQGKSKPADRFISEALDLVVTVCDDAAENCPVWVGKGLRAHLSFPDPAKASGTDEEVMTVFRQVLKDMSVQIPLLLKAKQKVLQVRN